MKSKLSFLFLLLAGFLGSSALKAQTITYTAGTVITCPGPGVHVLVHITADNYDSVAAMDLVLKYDASSIVWVATPYINPLFLTNGFMVQTGDNNNQQWAAIFFSSSHLDLGDDTLFTIDFLYKKNWTPLTWDLANSGTSDSLLIPINSNFVNGLVSLTGPVISVQPVTTTAPAGTNAQMFISGTNITAYQWQISTDGINYTDLANGGFYSNVNSATLDFTAVNPSIDGTWFRCKTTGPCGDQYSFGAKLLVVSTTPVGTSIPTNVYCKGTITVPVSVTDFYNVRNFKLSIDYNIPTSTPVVLTYNTLQNLNSDVVGTMVITPGTNSLLIEFTGDTNHTANFGNGTLFDLVFVANAGTTEFNWNLSSCEYLTPAGSPLFTTFQDNIFTVIPLPLMPQSISGALSICNDGAAYTYSTPINTTYVSYIWALSPPDAGTMVVNNNTCSITFDPGFTGVATLTVKGADSCGVSAENGVFINVQNPPNVSLDSLANVCLHADPVTLAGGTPANGTYSGPGVYNNTFIADSVGIGTYIITYTFTNTFTNCTAHDTTLISVLTLPTVSFSVVPQQVCYNWSPLFLSGGSPSGGTYSGPGVASATGIFSPGFGLIGDQNIKYEVTGSNGCKNAAFSMLHVDNCMGIAEQGTALNFNVQPNPNQGLFDVNVNNLSDDTILSIYNNIGQQVYEENLSASSGLKLKLDLSNQPKGMYFVMLNCKGEIKVEKLILK